MPEDIWTVSSTLAWTQGYLARHDDVQPRVSAQWLLGAATGLSRMELYTQYDRVLSELELGNLRGMILRRAKGEPLQYITGRAPFRTIEVAVEPGVLIPRPETEVLVGEALTFIPKEEPSTVLDLCCGSGCIACAVAVERPEAGVIAVDIDDKAVALTERNAKALGVADRVEVYQGDLFAGVPEILKGGIDVIVTNPPYIPTEVLKELPAEVADYEPRLALDGGEDGLDLFRAILTASEAWLSAEGVLVVELHEACLEEAQSLAEDAGFARTRIVNDLAGKPRVLIAWRES
ncbi:MAG: peptide chain release factor N(5)-glutamine methyltransferase [Eggerthellaceae bacterium]|nr:peptide chain release factor N(5)-glutamine methyltransferase [Eggerthellaceae bacterium]